MSTKSVLVVEDKELNRKVVRIVLEAEGYEMLEATTAEETLQILNAKIPDLILMDIALPGGVDGEELTRQIKTDPRWQHVPILALTAAAMKGDRERILEAGCDDYISKPIDTHVLVNLVGKYAGESGE
ncbi:MAG: response regulator [Candidatus Poribacteria bacterium]|nr:response regulator [Candidatus Poribacteria bacterium]